MGDRVPFHLPGALAGWVDTDQAIAVMGIAGSVIRTFMNVGTAPSGTDFVCALRDEPAGGGEAITVTIAAGANHAAPVTVQLAVSASETLYLRVTTDSSAEDLSGWFEFEPTGTSAITTFLTSLSRVKTEEGISGAGDDAQLNNLIAGVSAQMQKWMRRAIVETTYTDEVYSGDGWTDGLVLQHHPITDTVTMIVKQDDSALDSSLYTQDTDAGIVHRASGFWASGARNFKLTYSAGYKSVPEDLVMAATAQVRHEFHQSQPGGQNRLGLAGSTEATGGSSSYVPGGLLPSTIEAMLPHRRMV